MKSPLDPFLDSEPSAQDLAALSGAKLRAVIVAAIEVEELTPEGVAESKSWARGVRLAAEQALANRNGK